MMLRITSYIRWEVVVKGRRERVGRRDKMLMRISFGREPIPTEFGPIMLSMGWQIVEVEKTKTRMLGVQKFYRANTAFIQLVEDTG
jgi:hypothetical protein